MNSLFDTTNWPDGGADGAIVIRMHRNRNQGSFAIEVNATGEPEPTRDEILLALERAAWLFRGGDPE